MTLYDEAQSLNPDALVELYTLDATKLTSTYGVPGSIYHWMVGTLPEAQTGVLFSGNTATSLVVSPQLNPAVGSPAGYTVMTQDGGVWQAPSSVSSFASATLPSGITYTVMTLTAPLAVAPATGSQFLVLGPGVATFGGVPYIPFPIVASGFEWSSAGMLPRPKLILDNTILMGPESLVPMAAALVIGYGDLLGATVTRMRTFAKHLDGGADPNSALFFEPDVFRIDRKSSHGKNTIEFELASDIDQMGLMLPRRQMLRDVCSLTYRTLVNGAFVAGTCPYAGTSYFDGTDQIVYLPQADVCSKTFNGCRLRYGTQWMPFGGFPGVGLV